jgi:hypothetical protein
VRLSSEYELVEGNRCNNVLGSQLCALIITFFFFVGRRILPEEACHIFSTKTLCINNFEHASVLVLLLVLTVQQEYDVLCVQLLTEVTQVHEGVLREY